MISDLRSDGTNGLSQIEVLERLNKYGANKIEEKKGKNTWLIFFRQFKSPIVWILVFAAGLSVYFGEWLDGITILVKSLVGVFYTP